MKCMLTWCDKLGHTWDYICMLHILQDLLVTWLCPHLCTEATASRFIPHQGCCGLMRWRWLKLELHPHCKIRSWGEYLTVTPLSKYSFMLCSTRNFYLQLKLEINVLRLPSSHGNAVNVVIISESVSTWTLISLWYMLSQLEINTQWQISRVEIPCLNFLYKGFKLKFEPI
jgi:hypothetical protein